MARDLKAALEPVLKSFADSVGVVVLEARSGSRLQRMETEDAYEMRITLPRVIVSMQVTHSTLEDLLNAKDVVDHIVSIMEKAKSELRADTLRKIFDDRTWFDGFKSMLLGLAHDEAREGAERYALQLASLSDLLMRKAKALGA